MSKRRIWARKWALAALLVFLFAGGAKAEYWTEDTTHEVYCRAKHPGCEVLQMVMMGSFGGVDTSNMLNVRVMSAALAQLSAVTEADIEHFCASFGVEEAVLRTNYHIALGHCLLADIILDPGSDGAEAQVRRILKLFLDPQAEWNAQLQMDIIRKQSDEALIDMMAQTVALPEAFIRYVIGADDQATEQTASEAAQE